MGAGSTKLRSGVLLSHLFGTYGQRERERESAMRTGSTRKGGSCYSKERGSRRPAHEGKTREYRELSAAGRRRPRACLLGDLFLDRILLGFCGLQVCVLLRLLFLLHLLASPQPGPRYETIGSKKIREPAAPTTSVIILMHLTGAEHRQNVPCAGISTLTPLRARAMMCRSRHALGSPSKPPSPVRVPVVFVSAPSLPRRVREEVPSASSQRPLRRLPSAAPGSCCSS